MMKYIRISLLAGMLIVSCEAVADESPPLPRITAQQVALDGVRVWDHLARQGGMATMQVSGRNIFVKVLWKNGKQSQFTFVQPRKAGIESGDYAAQIATALAGDAGLSGRQIRRAAATGSDVCNAVVISDAVDTERERSGHNEYYSGEFMLFKTHRLEQGSSKPVYRFALEFNVEQKTGNEQPLSLSFTYEHVSATDIYRSLVPKTREKPAKALALIRNASARQCRAVEQSKPDAATVAKKKATKNQDVGLQSGDSGVIVIGGCRFEPPGQISNFRTGLAGKPDSVPSPPDLLHGESMDFEQGQSYTFATRMLPTALQSWYADELQQTGWTLLKRDKIDTRFGPFLRLFASNRDICLSISIGRQSGGEHRTIVSAFVYPGPG